MSNAKTPIQDRIKKACEEIKPITIKNIVIDADGSRTEEVQYATVNERLKAFRSIYPESTIETSVLFNPNDKDHVIVKATIYNNKGILATGLAREKLCDIGLETCETSAIGRALAFAGFNKSDFIASYEEVQMSKVTIGNKQNKASTSLKDTEMNKYTSLSKNQRNWLVKISNNAKVWLNNYLDTHKKKSIEELTTDEVNELINSYKKVSGVK